MSSPELESTKTERLRRLEALDELLPTLAGVLDIREVFERMSAIAMKVLPHDMMSLPLLAENGRDIVVYAVAGTTVQFPKTVPLADEHRSLLTEPWEFFLFDDLLQDAVERDQPPARAGFRSLLRIAIRVQGQVVGSLAFASRETGFYKRSDVLVGRRIADHVALALSHGRLAEAAQRAAEARERATKLERRVKVLTSEVESLGGQRQVLGHSAPWKAVLKQATQVASTETTVLLLGESGTGKEVIARFLHRASARGDGPFIALNCAALPEQLLEAELFGYERGAFTGATQSKPGQLEQASGGTLFLDEVAEMSPSAQAKFLRVLQEREFQRLGGTRVLRTDARVIAATNRDLDDAIARGTFREDLYYRLHVFAIQLPPLRDRPDDILPLSEAFLAEMGRTLGRPPGGISREARDTLLAYHWPGNVRELRNALERAAILCDGGLIATEHLALRPRRPAPPAPVATALVPTSIATVDGSDGGHLKSVERAMVERALRDAHGNKSEAAKLLGLTRAQLYVRLRRYDLQ
jgi:transcriptional regulator with GAF, ATPase, and Fis domain